VDDAANPNLPVVVVVLFPIISFPTTARLLNDFSNAPIADAPTTDDALEDVLIIVAELIARRIASAANSRVCLR